MLETIADYLNVNYSVEICPEDEPTSGIGDFEIVQDSFQDLDPNWIIDLNHAAKQLNGERILSLLQQLQPEHESLIASLNLMVHNFDFDKIVDLTQSHCHAVA